MKDIYIDDEGRVFEGVMADTWKQVDEWVELLGDQDIIDHANETKDKGGNRMKDKLFTKEDDIVVEFEIGDSKNTRRAKMIKEIVKSRGSAVLTKPDNYVWSGAVGLIQGLKYNGSLKTGIKGAVGGLGTILAVDIVANIANNYKEIKDA